ncbi:hypothetical protein ACJIZ3_001442 [Penstemon smallii]|uniref:Core-2/I-branching beta-1,6-N-acetylglucosaminyltransferase family protein n=1 Tax=Penstemon smallii TaxID=265156 RepID=A0ABD3U3L3_9LAMI
MLLLIPPTPLSLLCAILLCLPLAVFFTFTTTTTTTTYPLPITANITKTNPNQELLPPPPPPPPPPLKTNYNLLQDHQPKINQTTNTSTTRITVPVEDEEDISLFKLASRVDQNPTPTRKLAFLFLTTSPLPFAPLWDLYFPRAATNLYNIYIHAHPTLNHTTSFKGVFANRLIPSKPTRRHSPTLISAARRLLAHALLHDNSNSMFALLSPSCIPIHSFNYTFNTLINSNKSFIEILQDEPGAYDRWAARGEHAMLPEVEFEDFRIGSQFWVVKRKHARIIVSDRSIWSKFKLPCLRDDTCYPEEHYFPTLMNMVDLGECVPCTLTHVSWKGSRGGHPRMYKASDVGPELIRTLRMDNPRYGGEELDGSKNSSLSRRRRRSDPFLFARKFSAGSVQQLMRIANDVLFKD